MIVLEDMPDMIVLEDMPDMIVVEDMPDMMVEDNEEAVVVVVAAVVVVVGLVSVASCCTDLSVVQLADTFSSSRMDSTDSSLHRNMTQGEQVALRTSYYLN
ncbi:hypothetical protein DPMN_168635 [Dreissena polymorpha]|uniref:Uncharacterized protein n=1 Tax=Dreissena polymorpha TaxID=45954 RepID=A0A9D4F5H8_DREPO|nr:hypothetical protein DPMN_168635 [Dreissena polymorpha]